MYSRGAIWVDAPIIPSVSVLAQPTVGNRLKMRIHPIDCGYPPLLVVHRVQSQQITTATRLEARGYQAITANDGIEAIALYAGSKRKG